MISNFVHKSGDVISLKNTFPTQYFYATCNEFLNVLTVFIDVKSQNMGICPSSDGFRLNGFVFRLQYLRRTFDAP